MNCDRSEFPPTERNRADLESSTLAPRAEEAGTGKITPWPDEPPDTLDDLRGPAMAAEGTPQNVCCPKRRYKAQHRIVSTSKSTTSHERRFIWRAGSSDKLDKHHPPCPPTLRKTRVIYSAYTEHSHAAVDRQNCRTTEQPAARGCWLLRILVVHLKEKTKEQHLPPYLHRGGCADVQLVAV